MRNIRFIPVLVVASVLALVGAVYAQAASYRLQWDDPNPAGSVAKYRVYQEVKTTNTTTTPPTVTISWKLLAEPTAKEWPITLPPGFHNVAVAAVGTSGLESDRSTNCPIGILIAVVNLRVVQ